MTKIKLTQQEQAFADLIAVGWKLKDAWEFCIGTGKTWATAALKAEQEKLLNADRIQERINTTKSVLSQAQLVEYKNKQMREETKADKKEGKFTNSIVERVTNKSEMIKDITLARDSYAPGSTEWIKLNQQIIEVTQMKKDEVKTEDNTIHYYLPLSCNECPLHMEFEAKKQRKQNQDEFRE